MKQEIELVVKIARGNSSLAMPARLSTTLWRAKTFPIHQTKLRYYQAGDSNAPSHDPGDLPPFDWNDWADTKVAESTCFDDVPSTWNDRPPTDGP